MTAVSHTRRSLADLAAEFGPSPQGRVVLVDINEQRLHLYIPEQVPRSWPVSTSRLGVGFEENSHRTPTGAHRIVEKIGADAPLGMVFKGRRSTGQIARILTEPRAAEHDYITSRILRLQGLEPGVNQGPGVDTFERYIYIHGTAEEGLIGTPASHGCIRMRNADVIELFDLLEPGTLVYIHT